MIPLSLTFWIAKLCQAIIRRLGKGGGTALPGLLAYRLNKHLLPYLAKQLQGTVVVSGTNGKTTTSRLAASFLEGAKLSIVHNRSGSNLTRGIMSALVANAGWNKKLKAQWGIFEVDEAVFAEVVMLLQPTYVIASNLFRDQLDRYGEVNTLAEKWRKACQQLSANTTLIINVDDPLMANLAYETQAKVVTYGVEAPKGSRRQTDLAKHADSRRCPRCGQALVFKQVNYSHLGVYQCVSGDFSRPDAQYSAQRVALNGMSGSEFEFVGGSTRIRFELPLAGLYNVYNATAALTLAQEMKLEDAMVERRVKSFQAVFGRLEQIEVGETKLTLILVKNPTGYNQVIQTLQTEASARAFWLLLNDKFADGRDISWIWDIELEVLQPQAKHVVVGGTRAADMALRVKYADFAMENVRISQSLAEGLRIVTSLRESEVYCLCTYTAMLELRQLLQKNRKVSSYHQD